MFRRVGLFVLTNLLVITTISVLLNLFGVRPYLTEAGIDYGALMAFCLIWGMGGALISLGLSRLMAKWMMGVKLIEPAAPLEYQRVLQKVHNLARAAGLPAMPEVGVYQSGEINAFATGPTKARSLVAVSSAMIEQMDTDAVDGVLAHEVAHIKNGDMVTMTLIQGVMNAFTMFLSRVLAFVLSQNAKEESRALYTALLTIFFDIVLGILGLLVVCWFSRRREFRADAGSAELMGSERPMVAALNALQRVKAGTLTQDPQPALAALKINGRRSRMGLFATHPPLEERIAALSPSASR